MHPTPPSRPSWAEIKRFECVEDIPRLVGSELDYRETRQTTDLTESMNLFEKWGAEAGHPCPVLGNFAVPKSDLA